jgi:hypothetical protein
MTEFMLLVRNQADHQAAWPPERHLAFIRQCEASQTGFVYPR